MDDSFSNSEMEKIRLDYTQGELVCPRCGEGLCYEIEEGELIPGQLPGGPTFTHLVVECVEEGIWGRIMVGL